jgi:hypothetical protein
MLARTKLETIFRKRKTNGNLIRPDGPKAQRGVLARA